MPPQEHYRCRFYGQTFPTWLPAAKSADGRCRVIISVSSTHQCLVGPCCIMILVGK
jgi:hypothetical protein